MTDLERMTDHLETLFLQEQDGEPIDTALRDQVADTLTESDWFEIATIYWPERNGHTINDLEVFVSWIQDSPVWNT